MIYWPDELPAPLIGTEYAPIDPQIRTPMQSGRVFVRRNFTAVPVAFNAKWAMKTNAQAVLFEEFYKNTLEDGTLWFNMVLDLPQGKKDYLVQFHGIYNGPKRLNAPSEDGAWEYSADMMIFLRPGEQMPVDLDRNVDSKIGDIGLILDSVNGEVV